jgi:putative ABC transport system permease protein
VSLKKVAFFSLTRKKIRTVLLVISVMISISVLTGVNAGIDGLHKTYMDMVTASLGYTDLLIESNSSSRTFQTTSVEPFLHDELIAAYSWRIQHVTPFTSLNETFAKPSSAYIVGADPEVDEEFGDYTMLEGAFDSIVDALKQQTNSCIVNEYYAERMGLNPGDSLYVGGWNFSESVPAKPENVVKLKVMGIIRDYGRVYWFDPKDPENFVRVNGEVFLNLATAQSLFDVPSNSITHVYVHLADITKADVAKSRLQKNLGSSYSVASLKAKMLESIEKSVSSYRSAASLFGGMSLMVTVMLLLNSMFAAISERKYEIGVLRSIGASRGQIFYMFLLEILFIGVAGALLSIPLSIAVAKLITMSMPAPYIQHVGKAPGAIEFVFSGTTLLNSLLTGTIITLVIGLVPSIAAARVEIVRALRPHMRVVEMKKAWKALTPIIGFIFIFLGLYLIERSFAGVSRWVPSSEIFVGYAMVMIGVIFVTSLVLPIFSKAFAYLLRPFLGRISLLVHRNILLNLRRSVFVYGGFAISIALMVALGSLVPTIASYDLSAAKYGFGADVQVWVSAPPSFADNIKDVEGVESVAGAAYIWYRQSNMSHDGHYLKNGGVRMIGINSTDFFQTVYKFHLTSTLDGMTPNQVYSTLITQPRNIILQETLAGRLMVNVGDTVTWVFKNQTHTAEINFRVIALTDFVAGAWETLHKAAEVQGLYIAIVRFEDIVQYRNVIMGGSNFDQFFISLTLNANITQVIEDLNQKCRAYGYRPWIGWVKDTLDRVQNSYNQVETVAFSIVAFSMVISALGIMAAMAYTVLERKREIGILMALGVGRNQNVAIIIGETLLLALLGTTIGAISGFALSYFIVQIIPWWYTLPPPPLSLSSHTMVLATIVTIISASMSSAYPAYRVAKLTITDSLRR